MTALIILLWAVILLSPATVPVRLAVTSIGMVGGAIAMMVGFRIRAVTAARAPDPDAARRARAWNRLVVSGALAALSNALLISLTTLSSDPNAPLPSYVVLFAALLFAAAGIFSFPLARRRRTDLARMVLDGVVLGGSALFVASVTAFPTILQHSAGGAVFALAVPVADVIIATVAALLFLRAAPEDRLPLGMAAFGFTCYAVSDFAYAVVSSDGRYSFGTPTDLGWIIGYALFALAAHSPGSKATPHGERPVERTPVVGTAIMFSLFLTAAGLSLAELDRGGLDATSAILWMAVLLAVLTRQLVLIVDNHRLHRGLERAVEARTRELRQETQRSQLLVTSVGDGIYGVDTSGLVTFVNPAAAEVLRYAPGELIGREAHATFHGPRPNGTPFPVSECYITEAIRQRRPTQNEANDYRRSDGREVPVEVTATPLIGDTGEPIGAVVVFRDFTKRREVDRMKREFVSIVSHELRTPVTAIRGSLGLIAGGAVGELSPSAKRMVDIALDSTERLGRLVNEILDIERIESGMLPMDLAVLSCRTLVESAVGQVQVLAERAGVQVSITGAEGEVHADADRVVQTLLNLLGNAIKFSHPGGHVWVRSERRGEFVHFAIRDDGRGIPEDKLDQIFARFSQVDSSDAREKGGSGLGLSISKSIVERLGGRIWARNNADAGTTFYFTLPVPGSSENRSTPVNGAADRPVEQATDQASIKNLTAPAESRF